ncbi:MAG TPA: DJ-1/PfpI family protein [Puia sp.]|jgi:putative intracellular protease/amidase|nr:DJ-1/PfpI family protein [Puia sp.]
MRTRTCAAFIFDGFSDHELALTMAALNHSESFLLETFSTKGRAAVSRSGLRTIPHTSLFYMSPDDFDILLLPGGEQWEKGDNLEIFPLITSTAVRRPVIAFSEATLALADLGLLNDIPHTGNYPGYFGRYCPEYKGESFYRHQPCVSAGKITTVNGPAFTQSGHGMLGLFDTLQRIYIQNHELLDPAC